MSAPLIAPHLSVRLLLRLFIIGLSCLFFSAPAFSQSGTAMPNGLNLETVLRRHFAAIGDMDKVQARRVKLRIIGMAPFDIPTTVEARRPALLRRDVMLQGQVQVTAYDGKDAWKIDPFLPSGKRAIDLPAEELPALLEESYFDGILVAAQKQGFPMRYAGEENLDGRRVHVVKLTVPTTGESTIYLDAMNYLEIKRLQKRQIMGRSTELEVWSSDYRQQDGLTLPFRFEIAPKGASQRMSMVVDALENNPVIAVARFQRAAQP
ncbi:hypothetical protein [Undibacterium sp. TS12]|uniref:hypothetical protein n=1 Tax=Undibacterium sp. TS12 TaxID=2908202 RepID=UPI001F4D03EA|nr:hypothetical protein [Undibacterium sp. TS12]MCH8619785.1 hypothetical protein [Undibacterium sp. TS12]